MGSIRGFLVKHRFTALFLRTLPRAGRRRLNPPHSSRVKVEPFRRLMGWAHKLRKKAKAKLLRDSDPGRDYIRVGLEPGHGKPEPVPKGHVAVYVGQKDGDFERILVPVVYFNHPLFEDLLRESENEYGFDQPGGFTIPCRISEFERVQTRIETGRFTRKLLRWKSPNRSLVG